RLIGGICGYSGRIVWDRSQPDGQPRRMLDTTRARERFGFEARTDLEDGLRRTLDWYLATRIASALGPSPAPAKPRRARRAAAPGAEPAPAVAVARRAA
ncbi:MAG TPA: hypothetical protein VFF06_26725, partial [Polyangia bacterium]|nr:hypothetical protein [Polyangia bacterium]